MIAGCFGFVGFGPFGVMWALSVSGFEVFRFLMGGCFCGCGLGFGFCVVCLFRTLSPHWIFSCVVGCFCRVGFGGSLSFVVSDFAIFAKFCFESHCILVFFLGFSCFCGLVLH